MQKAILYLCLFFVAFGFAQDETVWGNQLKKKKDAQTSETTSPEDSPATPSALSKNEEKILTETYWKFHHSAYLGYRRDRQEFDAFGSGILSTRTQYKNRNSALLSLSSHAEFKSLVGSLIASYAWLMGGQAHFRDPGNTPPLTFPSFKLGSGYSVDVRGSLAWRMNLYKAANLKFFFLPGIGYRYAHMMNDPQGVKRFSLPDTQNFAICQFPKPNQQDWFGFFAEGKVELQFWDFLVWSLFCQYHQPYLVSKSKTQIQIFQYNAGGALISDQLSRINSVFKSDDLQMILSGMGMKFSFGPGWAVGAHFEGATTWRSARDHVRLKQEELLSNPPAVFNPKVKDRAGVRWTFYSISVMADHRF